MGGEHAGSAPIQRGGAEDRASALAQALLISAKAHAEAGLALMGDVDGRLMHVDQAAAHARAANEYVRALKTLNSDARL